MWSIGTVLLACSWVRMQRRPLTRWTGNSCLLSLDKLSLAALFNWITTLYSDPLSEPFTITNGMWRMSPSAAPLLPVTEAVYCKLKSGHNRGGNRRYSAEGLVDDMLFSLTSPAISLLDCRRKFQKYWPMSNLKIGHEDHRQSSTLPKSLPNILSPSIQPSSCSTPQTFRSKL